MAHTSQAGSLSAKFSEKLKIAGVKASGGDYKVSGAGAAWVVAVQRMSSCCIRLPGGPNSQPDCAPQELNVAVIKATTNQFHVVPKEKHVRSEWLLRLATRSTRLTSQLPNALTCALGRFFYS